MHHEAATSVWPRCFRWDRCDERKQVIRWATRDQYAEADRSRFEALVVEKLSDSEANRETSDLAFGFPQDLVGLIEQVIS